MGLFLSKLPKWPMNRGHQPLTGMILQVTKMMPLAFHPHQLNSLHAQFALEMMIVRNEISLVLHVFFLPSVLEEGVLVSGKVFVESILELSMSISAPSAKKDDCW